MISRLQRSSLVTVLSYNGSFIGSKRFRAVETDLPVRSQEGTSHQKQRLDCEMSAFLHLYDGKTSRTFCNCTQPLLTGP